MAGCVVDTLDVAHEAGLTHWDVKPSDVIVRPGWKATVVDFGITECSDERHDIMATGILIGTPALMAPPAPRPPPEDIA
ncbi:hypothetical protein [Streptomyces sp. NPDC052042]|uniref:hypothetical protein n=1 Tax=Streptomyces sp. NPDC052042 TaxID=3365683 RepID=UPI0037D3D3B5